MADTYTEAVVRGFAKYTELEPERIQLETRLEELGVDSLDTMSLVADLEDEFKVTLSDDDLETLDTVGDAVRALRNACEPTAAE